MRIVGKYLIHQSDEVVQTLVNVETDEPRSVFTAVIDDNVVDQEDFIVIDKVKDYIFKRFFAEEAQQLELINIEENLLHLSKELAKATEQNQTTQIAMMEMMDFVMSGGGVSIDDVTVEMVEEDTDEKGE